MRDLFGGRPGSEIDRIAREWQRVALRQMTAAQADALRQWCQADPRHGAAFAEAHRLWRAMAPAAALSEARPRAAFVASGASRLRRGLWHAPRRRRAWLWSRRHSACGRPGANWAPTHRTAKGEQRRVVLPGTAVLDLNTRTSAAARRRRRADQRRGRDLAGRREQSVHRQRGRRPCHGAGRGFELRHTDGSVRVTCLSGVVEVALASGGATLAAAQRLVP